MKQDEEFNFDLQQLCRFCYNKKCFYSFKEDKCQNCKMRNFNPVFVNARNHTDFVRDFRNRGDDELGSKIDKCSHVGIIDSFKHATINNGCSFASNDFEYFIWNWMKTNKKFKISEIFNKFVAPYIFKIKQRLEFNHIPIANYPKEYQNTIDQIPRSKDENQQIQDDNKRKLYFCWFCFKNVTSEGDIKIHIQGCDHKLNYKADKKRRWYFKMPKSKLVIMCTIEKCDCYSPHTDDECREMIARIKFRNFNFQSFNLEEKKINPWPPEVQFILPMFPNNLECYKRSLTLTAKVILNKYTVNYICFRDDESRPFFNLHDNNNKKTGQILNFNSYSEDQFKSFNFDIEFHPLCSGTYSQRIEFGFNFKGEEYCCQKMIRVDVGTPLHLEQFKMIWIKFNVILKRSSNKELTKYLIQLPAKFKDLKFDSIIPFSFSRLTNNSILTEDLLRRVFRVVSNLQWMDSRVESWNYCDWMRDMIVHEELQQQLLLSQLLYIGDMKIAKAFEKENYTHYRKEGMFGTITFKNEYHDAFAREFIVQNINKVFLLYQGINKSASLYECDLVDKYYYDVESRSVNEVTLFVPEIAVNNLQLKDGVVVKNISIVFRFNRLLFERRHASLDKMPHYDSLSYTPLCCPSFTRLPYGDDQSTVSFNPKLTLNKEQIRLPHLVLRNINSNEIVLPFILNGAFGTGKSSVIAETVITILHYFKSSRVLICTRSYSAGKVYLDMFKNCLSEKFIETIKFIVSPKKLVDYNYGKFWINNDNFNMCHFRSNKVFITTLDNITYAMSTISRDLKEDMFEFIFVDEAAQVLEIDAISVYQFGNKKSKFIFAGDVFQIRPDYYNMSLKKFSVPIVCRLHIMYKQCPDYEICLKQVYRAHPVLVNYLADAIYMKCGLMSSVKPRYPNLNPMKFIDSNNNGENCEEFDEILCSYKNELEAKMIVIAITTLLDKYRDTGLTADKILICTPFYAQVKLIRDKMHRKKIIILVELPSNIQGKEFDAVFISTVLTINNEHKHPVQHATFHSNKNLINLAVSRAKHYVEVIGDKRCLLEKQCGYQWRKFLEFCS